jgi:hypothetical protein
VPRGNVKEGPCCIVMPRPETIRDNERRVIAEFVMDRIELDELDRALDHVYAGGMGNADFPYLPVYEALE